jgi:glycosyltransferase involved in cell wall biosynthesis
MLEAAPGRAAYWRPVSLDARQATPVALSVVVPVYNLAGSIVENVRTIRDRVAAGTDGPIEVIVVSDGSFDSTEDVVLESELENVRVLHYDRNLGKGYAVKIGALEANGRWVAYCDADLDLDPASLPEFVRIAERDGLDFAIGSKRHPESLVSYPGSRRVASWLFQQLVRVLFRLDVRDTQVGLKVFRREVAEQVVPLLLVKRYAFDIELLAVARAFGFGRIRELPIRLDYQFAGSGVRPLAVAVALTDTAAIFYRLRILRTYQRKRALVGKYGWTRPTAGQLAVTLIGADERDRRRAAEAASTELLAFVEPGGTPSDNFVTATAPFFSRPEIAAVVVSKVAPGGGPARARAAAAIRESRLGGGSQYYRFMPGNIRYVRDFLGSSYLVRRSSLLALPPDLDPEQVPAALAERGASVLYTPEAFVTAPPEPLFGPHLRNAMTHGRTRGAAIRRRGLAALRPSTALAILTAAFVAGGWLLGFAPWLAALALYWLAVLFRGAVAALQYTSLRVGGLVAVGLALTHGAYIGSLLVGLIRGR